MFQVRYVGLETPQNTLRLQACDSESLRFFWPNAIFVIIYIAILLRFLREKLATWNV